MAMDVAIDAERGVVDVALTGPVGADEFLAGFRRMLQLPDFRPGLKILVDMLAHVHQADGEDIRRIAAVFFENGEAIRGTDVAVVVARPVSYGLLRMLQTLVEDAPFRFSVSYSLEEARKSLGLT
jgi:hypothetical protein